MTSARTPSRPCCRLLCSSPPVAALLLRSAFVQLLSACCNEQHPSCDMACCKNKHSLCSTSAIGTILKYTSSNLPCTYRPAAYACQSCCVQIANCRQASMITSSKYHLCMNLPWNPSHSRAQHAVQWQKHSVPLLLDYSPATVCMLCTA